jgi:hypothetical protein
MRGAASGGSRGVRGISPVAVTLLLPHRGACLADAPYVGWQRGHHGRLPRLGSRMRVTLRKTWGRMNPSATVRFSANAPPRRWIGRRGYRFDPRCDSHDVARVILDARRRLGVGVSAVCARSTRASYPCEHQQNVFLLGNLMDWTQNRVAEPHLPLRWIREKMRNIFRLHSCRRAQLYFEGTE